MWSSRSLLLLGCVYLTKSASSLWTCSSNEECSALAGSVCSDGSCACAAGQQQALGGTLCADIAPYHTSSCVEDFQCARLLTTYECRKGNETDTTGSCRCQPNHHYFLGRCWPSIPFGSPCTSDEECLGVLRDPYSMVCNGSCSCAQGYFERQRGECRRIGFAVGDGCVLDEDCQFEGGACNTAADLFVCYDVNAPAETKTQLSINSSSVARHAPSSVTRQHGAPCSSIEPCSAPFECTSHGCVCPVGYYASDDEGSCLAELGSPASVPEECVGLFAIIDNGVCTCPANFYFDDNMRDCIKASRIITDSCVSDSNCHTFGASSRCGAPQEPWGLRNCECIPDEAVWDAERQMCRFFAGIGEACEVDSDCLAGELEIQCVQDGQGQGYCACPDNLIESEGLCLTSGLGLGDTCQVTAECTGAPNTVCFEGTCSCDSSGYQEVDGECAPIIGGACAQNSDCVIFNTVCRNESNSFTCQCNDNFVEFEDACWQVTPGIDAPCEVNAQCEQSLGSTSYCEDNRCSCAPGHHYRGGACWPMTGLFDSCSRSSQCFLSDITERVVCRNSLCQCDFHYPYSEELQTCLPSSTSAVFGSWLVISTATALRYLFSSY